MEHITHNKKNIKKAGQKICSMFTRLNSLKANFAKAKLFNWVNVPRLRQGFGGQACSMKQRGFVASLNTLLVLIFLLSLAMTMSVLISTRQKISTNAINATQSYYTAQAGIEDSLMRLKNNPQMAPLNYTFTINNSTADVIIPALLGGSRTINSQGNNNGLIKTTQVVYAIDSDGISFRYGAQVGSGGLVMNNGSKVQGNVFSNGNITGSGTIDNDVIIAGNGHSVKDVYVGGNALTYSCLSSASVQNLTYVTGGSHTCTIRGTTTSQSSEIPTQALPISQGQIDEWKTAAASAGTLGNTTIDGTQSLGPIKINGSLTLLNNATLKITGTIYVTGNITTGNGATIKLDTSYGSLGGVILSDGLISSGNSVVLNGSGQTGSYLLVLSTNASDNAITVSNNATGAVFYTSAGAVELSNNVTVKEVTGYKIILKNNSTVTYDSGLADTFFSSGPGGGWKVTSWQEQ